MPDHLARVFADAPEQKGLTLVDEALRAARKNGASKDRA